MNILLADDDELVRETLATALVDEGYHVEVAADGREALAMIEKNPIDLLITDIIMPFTEGIELIAQTRKIKPDIKILAISGGGRAGVDGFLKIAKKIGANDAIKKPFQPQELIEKVQTIQNI